MQRLQLVALVALGLGIVAGCATNDTADLVYDPCARLAIAVVSDHAEDVTSVEAAVAAWALVLPVDAATITREPAEGALTVRFLDGERTARGMYWDAVGVVEIARDMVDPAAHPIAIAHELGHAFGLGHVGSATRASVMNVGNLTVAPTAEDAAAVRALWAACRDAEPW